MPLTNGSSINANNQIVQYQSPDPADGADIRTTRPSLPSSRKQACSACRQRKKRCDGRTPICGLCARAGNLCFYAGPRRSDTIHDGHSSTYRHFSQAGTFQRHGSMTFHLDAAPQNPAWNASHHHDLSNTGFDGLTDWTTLAGLPQASFPGENEQAGSLSLEPQTFREPEKGAFWSCQSPLGGSGGHPQSATDSAPLFQVTADLPTATFQITEPLLSTSSGGKIELSQPLTHDRFTRLFTLFMDRRHSVLPCLDHFRLRVIITESFEAFKTNPLCWAIAGSAAWYQKDDGGYTQSVAWLQKACFLVEENIKTIEQPLPTLQALVYIIYHSYVSAAMVDMWVQLGKACRLAILLGWDRLDTNSKSQPSPHTSCPATESEREEIRRTVWMLFLLDRAASCMTGWPFVLRDQQFFVNYPSSGLACQDPNYRPVTESFSVDLSKLLSPESFRAGIKSDRMGFVLRGYVLLGRIVEYHNDLHTECDPGSAAFSQLEDALTRFHLIISRADLDNAELSPQDRFQDVWLRVLIEMCTIFHYHPTVDGVTVENSYDQREVTPGFNRCMAAGRKIVQILKDESFNSTWALINPMILPSCFLACRFLTITWHEVNSVQDKNSIETILMLIDGIAERYGPLARKYRKCIEYDVNRDSSEVHLLRKGTGCYISESCNT